MHGSYFPIILLEKEYEYILKILKSWEEELMIRMPEAGFKVISTVQNDDSKPRDDNSAG